MPRLLLIFLLLAVPAHAALVSSWNFEEGTGTNADDSVSNFDCTLAGNATWGAGLIGATSLSLDGIGDSCDISAPNAALQPTAQLAISAWYAGTTTDTGGNDMINLSDHYGCRVETGGNVKVFYLESAGVWREHVASPAVNVLDGGAHHLLCQKTATALEVFVDGVARGSTAFTTAISYTGGGNFAIGKNPLTGNQDTNGRIDQVRFYDAAIDASTLASLLAEGASRKRQPIFFP